MFLRELMQNPKYHRIGDQLNIILIPFENPDGAAVHYMLQKEHPNWKFHIARYNSLGKEFAGEYFKDDTMSVGKYIQSVEKAQGCSIKVDSFVRYERGEGIEKKQDDFAAEVEAMMKK